MYLLIINNDTQQVQEMEEEQAVEKFGTERLNLMIAGMDAEYSATDITEEMEGGDYDEYDGQPTMYEEMQDYFGGDDWDHGQFDEC